MNAFERELAISGHADLSKYIRDTLFNGSPITYARNLSLDDFMTEMIKLRTKLEAVLRYYNQVINRLYVTDYFKGKAGWILLNEFALKNLEQYVAEIKQRLGRINDQWLL